MTPPERYALVRRMPLVWRDGEDGFPALHDPARDEWVRLAEWTREVLVGLDAGEGLDALRARLDAGGARSPRLDARLRRFLQSLARVGYLEIHVPVPARIGRFEILRELGRGGVGIAYLAHDPRDGREVVVKSAWGFLHPIEAAEAALAREAEILARLHHRNVVRAVELVDHEGARHLARELVVGESLTERAAEAPLPRDEALRICRAAADALAHLHERRLLLVDQKPGNWYVERGTGRVVLMDLGHAAEQDGEGFAAARRGTPGFLPPEIQRDGRASVRSDVWGLGRLYAFARTGRLFRRPDVAIADVLEGLSTSEADAVRGLCDEDPAKRPSTAQDALRVLDALA